MGGEEDVFSVSHAENEVYFRQPGGDGQKAGGFTGVGRSLARDTSLGVSDALSLKHFLEELPPQSWRILKAGIR